MKEHTSIVCLLCFLFGPAFGVFPQSSPQPEKVAEGQYMDWQDGHPLTGTTQTWTIWRASDGYEVKVKLPPDQSKALMALTLLAGKEHLSTELRQEMQNATMTTDIDLKLTGQMSFEALILNGKKLAETKEVVVANCGPKGIDIACKGLEGSLHLKNGAQDQLLYSYPFPLQFTPILKQAKPEQNQEIPVKVAMLDEVNNKFQLSEVRGILRNEGHEKLVIGENSFDAEKYVLELEMNPGTRRIKLWSSHQGTVFGMEDSKLAPGHRILLTQYKKYSDF